MITRVFLVRHGATPLTADDRFAGSSDVPLGPEGRIQVERLADRLTAAPIAAIYSSPLRRTIATATIVGSPHGLTPVLADGLREIDHGRWEGLRRVDVQQMYPDEVHDHPGRRGWIAGSPPPPAWRPGSSATAAG